MLSSHHAAVGMTWIEGKSRVNKYLNFRFCDASIAIEIAWVALVSTVTVSVSYVRSIIMVCNFKPHHISWHWGVSYGGLGI